MEKYVRIEKSRDGGLLVSCNERDVADDVNEMLMGYVMTLIHNLPYLEVIRDDLYTMEVELLPSKTAESTAQELQARLEPWCKENNVHFYPLGGG
ncbi:MAG: hypothetical protein K8L97_15460 [Anaerolineae bacterium]|nr:hypothetical protein [Anaerolineae bacterium]